MLQKVPVDLDVAVTTELVIAKRLLQGSKVYVYPSGSGFLSRRPDLARVRSP